MNKLAIVLPMTLLAGALCTPVFAQEDITGPGLDGPVKVQVDQLGIPTIAGASETDVAFAQGYLHAADRFFQMDATRRQASGTSAELFGASQLPSDIQLRTLGLRRAALATWSALDAAKLGFDVTVRLDLCRAIDMDGSLDAATARMGEAGIALFRD